MKIIVDAMGGDNAPEAIVRGSISAANEYGMDIILSGREKEIKKYIDAGHLSGSKVEILNAEEVITNEDKPTVAIRRKKDSSLVRAAEVVKNGDADAMVSAGSTGAIISAGLFVIGRMEGIERPALAPLIPNIKGGASLLIDCGANVDCKASFLYDFAIMGHVYMEQVMGVKTPRIGLANIGTEKGKGNKLTIEAYELLENSQIPINFLGNVEARDILQGAVDIIVCDGFVGNIILKTLEGTVKELMNGIKDELMSGLTTKIGGALVKPALRNFKNRFDYTEHGGAPLLGVKSPVIKAHGSSNDVAIKNAIRQTKVFVENQVNSLIAESIVRR